MSKMPKLKYVEDRLDRLEEIVESLFGMAYRRGEREVEESRARIAVLKDKRKKRILKKPKPVKRRRNSLPRGTRG
jgi:hypothetical protein